MMTFTLKLDCDNAAFADDFDGGIDIVTAGREVARILSETVTKIRAGNDSGHCYDSNGNRVGDFAFTD